MKRVFETGWYLIYLPRRDGRLSWPGWQVIYRDGLPTQTVTHSSINPAVHGRESNYSNLLITSPTSY